MNSASAPSPSITHSTIFGAAATSSTPPTRATSPTPAAPARSPRSSGSAVDSQGRETTDATKVAALLPFGAHKGYGMALIDEILTAYIGSSIPTIRCRPTQGAANDKHTPAFYFQCMRPDAIGSGSYAL